jgi:hypothetical protein
MIEGRVIGDQWTRLYVRSVDHTEPQQFSVFRAGDPLHDHATGEVLGHQIIHVGEARLVSTGDPARVDMQSATREVLVGDRMLPLDDYQLPRNFYPRLPGFDVDARIIAVLDGVSQIGQYMTVIIDRGAQDGIEAGHTLISYQASEQVRDQVSGVPGEMVTIPPEPNGKLLVYRPFERVSYALVMDVDRTMKVHDQVGLPGRQ